MLGFKWDPTLLDSIRNISIALSKIYYFLLIKAILNDQTSLLTIGIILIYDPSSDSISLITLKAIKQYGCFY